MFPNMTRLRRLKACIALLFFVPVGISQSSSIPDADWTQIRDDKLEFSISFPSDFLVDNEIEKSYILAPVLASLPEVIDSFEKPKIIGNKKSARMSLSVFYLRQVPNAKNYLWYFVGSDTPKSNYQDFQKGEFVGRATTFDTEKTMSMSIAIAAKNKVFLINAFAKNDDKSIYEKFITSLMLNGVPLLKSPSADAVIAPRSLFISALQTSPEILDVLKRKRKKFKIEVTTRTGVQENENDAVIDYSRPLIILRKPDFDFIDIASKNNYSGLVRLRTKFLANGEIGDIVIVSESPKEITQLSISAVQKIKFLPAEINGKKVDATKTLEYGFNVR